MPWGSHLCLFHETVEDLLAVLVPYFKAGLEDGEFCLWVLTPPITEQAAMRGLRQAVPDLDRHLERRSLELHPEDAWYHPDGTFDVPRVVSIWHDTIDQAVRQGYAGIRVAGSSAWLHQEDWRHFQQYEDAVNRFIADRPMLALCTFPTGVSVATDVLDVSRAHQVALALRNGVWDGLETRDRIADRMRHLETAHAEALLARLDAEEAERRRFARDLHDEMGGTLTALGMMLERTDRPLQTARAAITDLMRRVHSLLFDLRPLALDELGLLATLLMHFDRYTASTGIRIYFAHAGIDRRFRSELETAAYRIVQEALTNVARHAWVTEVAVRAHVDGGLLRLEIDDQGRGFDPERVVPGGGLPGMRERARLLGGQLRVESRADVQGTRVIAELPVA
jgi:signal transduction histidine kinase